MKDLAPIVLFVYNRPAHVKKTIAALQNNHHASDSDLIIYSDAAKDEDNLQQVKEVRVFLKSVTDFKSVKIIHRSHNFGLSENIINGVTEVVSTYGNVIVLEDDLVTSPYFLQFMNDGLSMYQDNHEVVSIHGYVYPVSGKLPDTFFLRGADCWGWATWKHGWDIFESDGKYLLNEIKNKSLEKEFNFNDSYPYLQMLIDQVTGKTDSWAIRWHASAFLKDKFTLYPGKSLVQNIGIDDSGTHHKYSTIMNVALETEMPNINKLEIKQDEIAFRLISQFMETIHPPIWKKILRRIGAV
ncbi:MAG: glycosyltransferase [Ignavibacteriales bacterium]|nr:glycosyltransferase [Ignavibacteriales bacterium]